MIQFAVNDLHSRAKGRHLQPVEPFAATFVLRDACTRYGHAFATEKDRGDRESAIL